MMSELIQAACCGYLIASIHDDVAVRTS